MFEIDDCDDFLCGGARPPDFMIPPPPMSAELQAMLAPTFQCSEDDPMDTADMCHAIPVSFIFFFCFSFHFAFGAVKPRFLALHENLVASATPLSIKWTPCQSAAQKPFINPCMHTFWVSSALNYSQSRINIAPTWFRTHTREREWCC